VNSEPTSCPAAAFEDGADGLVEMDAFDGFAHEGSDGEDGQAFFDGGEAVAGGDGVGDDDAFNGASVMRLTAWPAKTPWVAAT